MREASEEFATDPCSSMKRGAMVRAARALLSAVTRLLILADMVDVHLLLKSLRLVSIVLTLLRQIKPHTIKSVQTQMKWCIMLHFIWVFTVCRSSCLGFPVFKELILI